MKKISIGRDTGNQIILSDNFVSRRHAELIIFDNGQIKIKDLESSNGTFVNGNRITECCIISGDIVKCASVFLNWQQYAILNSPVVDKPIISPSPISINHSGFNNQSAHLPTDMQPASTTASPSMQNQSPDFTPPIQQNVVVMGKAKSVGLAFLLSLFFGPLGLFYATVVGGLIMLILTIPLLMFTLGLGLFFINPICSIWAVIAANQANEAQKGSARIIQNNFNS